MTSADSTWPHWAEDGGCALAIDRINEATVLEIRSVSSQWTGLRTFSPDRYLVIGEDPIAPEFFWLAGRTGDFSGRASLTFLIPLAFAVTVPAETITAKINWWMLVVGAGVTVLALVGARAVWRWGISNYSGASA